MAARGAVASCEADTLATTFRETSTASLGQLTGPRQKNRAGIEIPALSVIRPEIHYSMEFLRVKISVTNRENKHVDGFVPEAHDVGPSWYYAGKVLRTTWQIPRSMTKRSL